MRVSILLQLGDGYLAVLLLVLVLGLKMGFSFSFFYFGGGDVIWV